LSQEVEPDLQKAAGGNKAAGTRVRKTMQEIRSVAQEIRVKVLEARDTPPA
ncbi:MAG: histone H1, partial [Phycisphaerales bacterium]